MSDSYRTLGGPAVAELKVKGSRFLAEVRPVASAEEAEAAITAVRKREYNATHHCTAYRLGPDGVLFRYNDDGEPTGSAGPPLLRQIDGRGLTDTLVVVTRYYGGVKLGTGGLARAYGEAAALALDAAVVVERILRTRLRLRFTYADTSPAQHTLRQFDVEILETRYSDQTELVVGVRQSEADAFLDLFTEALGGRGTAVVEER